MEHVVFSDIVLGGTADEACQEGNRGMNTNRTTEYMLVTAVNVLFAFYTSIFLGGVPYISLHVCYNWTFNGIGESDLGLFFERIYTILMGDDRRFRDKRYGQCAEHECRRENTGACRHGGGKGRHCGSCQGIKVGVEINKVPWKIG